MAARHTPTEHPPAGLRRRTTGAAGLALLLLGCAGPRPGLTQDAAGLRPGPTQQTTALACGGTEAAALRAQAQAQLNAWRAAGGACGSAGRFAAAPPLVWNETMARAALVHAADMARQARLSHAGSNGLRGGERLSAAGYDWARWGENIAMGQDSVAQVMQAWSRSPAHCANALQAHFTQFALACAQAAPDAPRYWALVLAAPQPPQLADK